MKLKSLIDFSEGQRFQPMTREQSEMFIRCSLMEHAKKELLFDVPEERMPMALRIMLKRLQIAECEVTLACALFCATLCKTPAQAVMWAYTFCHFKEMNGPPVTLDQLVHVFPCGFPTEKVEETCWDAQKGDGPCGNLMDDMDNWKEHVHDSSAESTGN